MRPLFLMISVCISMVLYSVSSSLQNVNNPENTSPVTNDTIKIKVGSQVFTATLLDHYPAKAFKEMLPLTIAMTELNGNEKYSDLPKNLPTNMERPKTIKNGDLMLYGSQTLVLFYKAIPTSYSYTRLGTINNTTGLTTALGSENISVTFEAE
ncbi:hypothetical protein DRF65_03865 [Chryseobacterium pennae]|uniref:Cyclophilin-like domain-containing protein n=1 Tax=Chryseobacterium pennae TaxID=2258962 RepID=A0A3D9CEC4_9FLAO|nr:cyclophilin-like fold protein [Chryseobacterium pennae]REC63851.1 hypothetical protein DRF65_03865 [Chryseobacterium pennae]